MPFPLSIPYPTHFHQSHWGPATSNTNFCELDYQFTPYIAELINTLSNVTYLIYAAHGLRQLYRRNRLTPQSALPHIGILLVGLGSIAFHASLLKLPQLADEIGMAVPTGAVTSRLLSFRIHDPVKRNAAYIASIGAVVAVYAVHCLTFTNWIHYPAFGAMVFFVGRRCITLIRGIEDPRVRREVRRQTRLGEYLFLGAFAIWLVDRLCCAWLVSVRNWLGLPWGWILELHGWWHLGTGMGAFVFVQVAQFLVEDGGKGDPGMRLSPFRVRLWGAASDDRDDDVVRMDGKDKAKVKDDEERENVGKVTGVNGVAVTKNTRKRV